MTKAGVGARQRDVLDVCQPGMRGYRLGYSAATGRRDEVICEPGEGREGKGGSLSRQAGPGSAGGAAPRPIAHERCQAGVLQQPLGQCTSTVIANAVVTEAVQKQKRHEREGRRYYVNENVVQM